MQSCPLIEDDSSVSQVICPTAVDSLSSGTGNAVKRGPAEDRRHAREPSKSLNFYNPNKSMWKLNQFVSGGDDDGERGESLLEDESDGFCSLSPMQRIFAFGGCSVAGLLLMLLSLIAFAKPIKFALLFTFGNMLAVGSTAFLIGPGQQLSMMFDPVRIYATAIYIGCVVLALICALLLHSKILTVLAIICEICALIWYSLSYIPFARRMVSGLMVRFCDTEL